MPVKPCVLKGEAIHCLEELYEELVRCLTLPDYFGHNLDALWDILSTDLEGPIEIRWENAAASKKAMGGDFERVARLFRDLEDERKDFSITYH